ncbi:MAG: CDP-alcohol phosphatidyltransferase family protein [Ruminococcus sp.]|nr:CDP-alcohol phosphatidyltransferase family protein [Ruminococcus sp.]
MIGYYNYTVILTYIGLISSVLGIFFSLGICGGTPHPEYAVICLMLSGLCDMFDGKIARTRQRTECEKNFGIQIDSLCDLVCFGVLPSVIGYSIGMNCWADVPILVVFPLCAVIRLAYFNVAEEDRQKKTTDVRKVYEGLPVTSVSLIFPLLYSFRGDIGKELFPNVYGVVMLLIAIAFITRFKVKKPGMRTMLVFLGLGIIELAWLLYKLA